MAIQPHPTQHNLRQLLSHERYRPNGGDVPSNTSGAQLFTAQSEFTLASCIAHAAGLSYTTSSPIAAAQAIPTAAKDLSVLLPKLQTMANIALGIKLSGASSSTSPAYSESGASTELTLVAARAALDEMLTDLAALEAVFVAAHTQSAP